MDNADVTYEAAVKVVGQLDLLAKDGLLDLCENTLGELGLPGLCVVTPALDMEKLMADPRVQASIRSLVDDVVQTFRFLSGE